MPKNKKLKKIKRTAVILCGGRGTRLGSLGKKIPKSLIKIQKHPIIWYIIKILKKNSFNHFIIPLGYKGHMIERFISKNSEFKDLNIETINTGINTTIASRINSIKKNIKSRDFLLLNGDAILDFDLKRMFKNHIKKKVDLTFIACEAKFNYGIVGKKNNKIVSFERDIYFNSINQTKNSGFVGFVYSGISIMSTKLLKLNFKNFENFEKSFYPKIIKNYKTDLKFLNGFWSSVDNIKDIDILNNKLGTKYKSVKKIKEKLKK
jgi:glucose-1-phosphate cytidylyltransferase